jgi:Predicted periplasmic solute-binding protein
LKSVRVGCVKYLNARPLIRGWPGNVEFDHPAALCQRLAKGQLDVALVSSFEFLRNPIYRIVDDISISSDGPVYSVVVAHRGEFSDIEEIELDPASETAVNLLRCLLAELGLSPRLTGSTPENTALPRARLIIGDQAIIFRQNHPNAFQFWDLGEQWKKLTGLPFVYALWLIRPEVPHAESIAQPLRELRDENLADISAIVADEADNKQAITKEFLDRYYDEHLRFDFGTREKRGLQTFADLCAKHGVLPKRAREFDLV